jgi:hypothetical protein
MKIEQMLQQTNAAEMIARELNIDPATAQAGATALLPQILSGFKNPVAPTDAQPALSGLGGLGGLLGTIGALGGSGLLDNVASSEPTDVGKGNQILGQIFGSKEGSRAVAAAAAGTSGVEPSLLKKMLPILAMLAAGYVMKQAGQGGGLGGALGNILGGNSPAGAEPSSSREAPAASGGILDDLIGAAGKYLGR